MVGNKKIIGKVTLTHTETNVKSVRITSHKDNKNVIYIGDFYVNAETDNERGTMLSPGDNIVIDGPLDLRDIFLVSKDPSDYVVWDAVL